MLADVNKEIFIKWTVQLFQIGFRNKPLQQFEWKGKKLPSIFVLLQNLQKKLCISEDILICGLCLMMRVVEKNLKIEQNSIYKLSVACIYIAHKFYWDFPYDLECFSICTGIKMKDIAKLESKTLELLDYDLILSQEDYNSIVAFWK